MCNEYARRKSLEKLREEFSQLRLPAFEWFDNLIPNDLEGKESVKISDSAPLVRLQNDKLIGAMTTWGWKGRSCPRGWCSLTVAEPLVKRAFHMAP